MHDEEAFREHWQRCARYIEPALIDGAYSLGDVLNEVLEGRAKFWPLERSAAITRLHNYPRQRVCRVWLAGGELDELVGFLPALDNYAKSEGCGRIEIEGRKGWAKALPGYVVNRVLLTREL